MDNADIDVTDEFDAFTDRQLLLLIARDIRSVRTLFGETATKAQPMLEGLARNPMFKLLLK
jgi:hypothetical protein